MSREERLAGAVSRALDATSHTMGCRAVEEFGRLVRSGVKLADATAAFREYEARCNCWRAEAQEALDAA